MSCPFCEIFAKGDYIEIDAELNCILFEPFNPASQGHLLAVPTEHVETAAEDPDALGRAAKAAARYAIRNSLHDFNVIQSNGRAATQGVFHLHVHLVPRIAGDADNSGLSWPWTHDNPQLGRFA